MAEQSAKNHSRWDPKFHFFLVPVEAVMLGFAVYATIHGGNRLRHMHLFFCAVMLVMILLSLISRMYALRNQDRIIRAEESVRIHALGGSPAGLTSDQFIALRFASDDEVVALAERARREHLTRDQIKQAVQHWRPDHHRI